METPFYEDNHIRIFNKDCRSMDELPDESVQCVVTSPPYFGLRKYSGDQELIWGDNQCDHQWIDYKTSLIHENRNFQRGTQEEVMAQGRELTHIHKYSKLKAGFCSLCGAVKCAYGLESDVSTYVQHTIEIMREIRRVLRKDGVFFLNIADSYASGKGSCFNPGGGEHSLGRTRKEAGAHPLHRGNISDLKISGLKPKDLCLIPARIQIAAQEDGWWIRSVIILNRLNPMPESVKDRPTKSHEYIIVLTKSARYFWDADAVREVSTERPSGNKERKYRRDYGGPETHTGHQGFSVPYRPSGTGRNLRSVWTFPTEPFPSFKIDGRKVHHFAVFPEKLPETCIKAATPEVGCCSKCGAPWTRIIRRKPNPSKQYADDDVRGWPNIHQKTSNPQSSKSLHRNPGGVYYQGETLGWQPTCKCNASRVPSLVLDPLMGAGTTLLVAKMLNRYACGFELSEEYCQLAVERCRQQVLV